MYMTVNNHKMKKIENGDMIQDALLALASRSSCFRDPTNKNNSITNSKNKNNDKIFKEGTGTIPYHYQIVGNIYILAG